MSELAKTNQTTTDLSMPDGFDGVDFGGMSVRLPEIKIVQAMRPESIRDRKDLELGDLYDTLTMEKLEKPVPVIPVMAWHKFIEWEGKGANAVVLRTTNDPSADWVKGRTRPTKDGKENFVPPPVTRYLMMLVMRPGIKVPALMSFSKTNLTVGEQILLARQAQGLNLYDRAILLSTEERENKATGGQYCVFSHKPDATPVPENLKALAKKWIGDYGSVRHEAAPEGQD